MNSKEFKSFNFYGRRKGPKLRTERRKKLEKVLPLLRLNLDLLANGNYKNVFKKQPKKLWLEIGFGMGENLLLQMRNNPEVCFIGCEPYINGAAKLISELSEKDYTRIKIYDDDARSLLNKIPEKTIDKIFILWPDPWPKKRHHKRRLIELKTLDSFSRVLKDRAKIYVATDDKDYFESIALLFLKHSHFDLLEKSKTKPILLAFTRYEKKALMKGKFSSFITVIKKPA